MQETPNQVSPFACVTQSCVLLFTHLLSEPVRRRRTDRLAPADCPSSSGTPGDALCMLMRVHVDMHGSGDVRARRSVAQPLRTHAASFVVRV